MDGRRYDGRNGLYCIPNIPTEEIFSTPHKDCAEGAVSASKPLSYMGTLIEDIHVRFEAGRIVEGVPRVARKYCRS